MRVVERKRKGTVITIPEDFRLPGTNIILEKGDKVEIFEAKKKKEEEPEDDEMEEETDDEEDEDEVEEKKKKK